ncbi:hypothetical protein BC830DRAFT_1167684 [Chytriomyces sp. MP71]|nr:hypothetical protein BC830DRAFT_1167684 [Chytriomyces sp. MP71]
MPPPLLLLPRLRRAGLASLGTGALAAAAYFEYASPVRAIAALEDTPDSFQVAVRDLGAERKQASAPVPTWALYSRSVDYATLGVAPSDLVRFTRRVFGSKWYAPERFLSQTREDVKALQVAENETFGNMKCVKRFGSNEALWRYEHPDFNFALFFGAYASSLCLGFVEMKGDPAEDRGSRVLLPLLLEDASRKEKKE